VISDDENQAGHEPVGAAVLPGDRALLLDLQRRMLEIRFFEEEVMRLFMLNLVRGSTHLCQGQEAVAVGACSALREGDTMTCTYRGHGAVLAMGAPLDRTMAEILGKAEGLCGGKGGSMHLTDFSVGALGSFAIVGAHLPFAAGAALSAQHLGTGAVSIAFFGDGTTNIGAFHEALNLAAVWKLPVVFVCENNQYMEYTSIGDVTAVPRPAADRAAAYGLEPIAIDGNDADEVYLTAADVIARARRGDGPSLVEALTYRHGGHSRADPGKYRPESEVAAWLDYDPIAVYRGRLLRLGVDAAELDRIEKEVADQVDIATEEAIAGELPPPASAFTDLWADGGSSWRN
jgi:acetoin:2,6-dichlorophenolindophenol oxidoreductase subunit alpha